MKRPRFKQGDVVRHVRAAKLARGAVSIVYADNSRPDDAFAVPFNPTWTGPRYVVDWDGDMRTDCTFAEDELLPCT